MAQMFSDAHLMAVDHLVDPDLLQEVVGTVYQVISGETGGRPWPEINFRGDPLSCGRYVMDSASDGLDL